MGTFLNIFDGLRVQIIFIVLLYFAVIIAIISDLWSGIRKAQAKGEARTSIGYRRTVKKINEYFNFMLIFTVVDFIQMFCVYSLHIQNTFLYIPIIPITCVVGAIWLCYTEYRSIKENSSEKIQADLQDLEKILENYTKDELHELTDKAKESVKRKKKWKQNNEESAED